MTTERRATFAKVLIDDTDKPKTIYSFRLEKWHWFFAILGSLTAIAVGLVVLRGAVYGSVQDVAGDEFRTQLERFHAEAQPAIRTIIDERITAAQARHLIEDADSRLEAELAHAAELASISEKLGRLDERLASIERRLP